MNRNLTLKVSAAQIVECLDGKYICGDDTNLLTAYEHLAGFWKTIDLMFSKLTYFFSLCVSVDLIPIEIYAIRNSLEIYYSTIEKDRSSVRPVECLIIFMNAFKHLMKEFIHLKLEAENGAIWSLKDGASIETWIYGKKNIVCSISYDPANEQAFNELIVPKNIARILLRESNSVHDLEGA